jgi:hypothetical protein
MTASAARIEQARRLGPRGRIVQHATLHTGAANAVAPLRSALEDALATADFGDCGRLVLVRRLQLQHLPHHAGPVQLARALEAAWRALATQARPHHHPQAAQAPAVFFASRFDARLAWLQRVVRGQPTADWFWPAALPELAPPAPHTQPADRVATLLREEAHAAARQALTGWPDGDLIALAQALSPATLDAWREQLQAESNAPTPIETHAGATPSAPTGLAAAAVWATARRLPPAGTVTPAATAWLAALWLAPSLQRPPTPGEVQQVLALQSTQATDPDALVAAAGPATAAPAPQSTVRAPTLARSTLTEDTGPPPAPGWPVAYPGTPPHTGTTGTAPAALPPDGLPSPQGASPGPHTAVAPTATRPHRFRTPSALPWLADAPPSAHAGLLLLLNLLQALRFDAWLRDHPAGAQRPFVHTLLRQVLDHCSAPVQDPQRAWLASNDAEQRTLATARWDGGHRSTAQALRLWWLRLRRALRRHVRLALQDVVARDGWLGASATHIDVVYPLDEVALPLRRLGLDADPGWVPWFGHIVAFHFVPREQLPVPGEGDPGG